MSEANAREFADRPLKTCVVIPSNREVDETILEALAAGEPCDVAIVEAPGFKPGPVPDDLRVVILHEVWQDQDFGEDVKLLGRGSAALRNYGVWWAWWHGYEMILNLDDDCWPGEDFVKTYRRILTGHEQLTLVEGKRNWTSTLHRRGPDGSSEAPWFPRGFPYEERLLRHAQAEVGMARMPVVHMGLWDGTLDLNAVDKVHYGPTPGPLSREGYATRQHMPLCAMNFGCLREWAPYVYQIPWVEFGDTLPLHRYDDIIGGLLTCALARIEGATIGFGPPFVDHRKKDGDLLAHAAAENLGNVTISLFARILEEAAKNVASMQRTDRRVRMNWLLDHLMTEAEGTGLERICRYVGKTYWNWLTAFPASMESGVEVSV